MACYKDFSELLNVLNHRLNRCLTTRFIDRLTKGIVRVQN